jgi:hypothetical protein
MGSSGRAPGDFFGFFGALKKGDFFGVHPKKVPSAPKEQKKVPSAPDRGPKNYPSTTIFPPTAKIGQIPLRDISKARYNEASEEFSAGTEPFPVSIAVAQDAPKFRSVSP